MADAVYDTSFGPVTMTYEGEVLTGLCFGRNIPAAENKETLFTKEVFQQLEEYFSGKRTAFSVEMQAMGTPFQMKVWQALCRIPYGMTKSYGEIACEIGRPKAARAVGMANNRNPIMILIPCHRVIGAKGSLTGYAGGLDIKARLLDLEQHTA